MTRFAPGFIAGGLDQFTKILLHFDGGLTDLAKPSRVWTLRGGAAVSSADSKFGGTSLLCATGTGTGCIDTPDDTDFTLGSGDWTVDCWFNRTGQTTGNTRQLFGQSDPGNTIANGSIRGGVIAPAAGNFVNGSVNTTTNVNVTGAAITANGWRHYALARASSSLLLFLDGGLQSTVAISGAINDSAYRFAIGRCGEIVSTNFDWEGYIDEFRLSVGIARWTANFTPPTAPYS